MSRGWTWTILFFGGIGAILCAVLLGSQKVAVATGIVVVAIWIGFGFFCSWYFGLRRHVVAHLGKRWNLGEVLRHRVATSDRVNVQLALDWFQERSGKIGPFGIRGGLSYDHEGEVELGGAELVAMLEGNPEPVAIVWEPFPTSTEEELHCASNALYFVVIRDEPVCVMIQGQTATSAKRAVLQVLARNQHVARQSINEIHRLANEQSVYRGQVLSLQRPKGNANDVVVQFHDVRSVSREEIVLPRETLNVIERNVLHYFRHAEALRQAGQGTRHGVLLHGPPGTGKTLVTRYLATTVGATVFLVSGRQYSLLRATCQLARLLSPSLVILEDVDLIAVDRQRNARTPLLHELLDEMDGISQGADVVFLLTTNRPQTLEPALASRPGRVDQAIFFPLPDLECRRELFRRYSQKMNVERIDFTSLLERTEGASPAFLRELFRRATLIAIERSDGSAKAMVQLNDFEVALRELIETGGEWTRSFLGFPSVTN